jgi:hypothetical protein
VMVVHKDDIVVQIDGTKQRFHLSPSLSFFHGDLGLVHRDRPLRKRNQRVLHNASHLGGTPPPATKVDGGSGLVGTSFWATASPQATKPSHHVTTDVGDPSVCKDLCNGRPPPCVRCLRSDEMGHGR